MTPGSTTAIRSTGLISRIRSIFTSDSTMQPSEALAAPDRPVRAPCGTTGTRSAVAVRMTCWTCSTVRGSTTTAGAPASQKLAMSLAYEAVMSGSVIDASAGRPALQSFEKIGHDPSVAPGAIGVNPSAAAFARCGVLFVLTHSDRHGRHAAAASGAPALGPLRSGPSGSPAPTSQPSEPCDDPAGDAADAPITNRPSASDPDSPAELPPALVAHDAAQGGVRHGRGCRAGGGCGRGRPDDGKKAAPPPAPGAVSRALAAAAAGSPASLPDLTALIGDRESWVGTHPSDARSWAVLGAAYVEWGRRSADAAYYRRAEQALQALAGRTAGRQREHGGPGWGWPRSPTRGTTSSTAKKWGETVRARQPKDWTAYPLLIDAYDGLGDYKAAGTGGGEVHGAALGRPGALAGGADVPGPGPARGRARHRADAADQATAPAEQADCLHRLGELAWERGEPGRRWPSTARPCGPTRTHHPSLAGRARALAALGRTDEAQRDYRAALAQLPRPEYMLELGELYESLGLGRGSRSQYDLLQKSLARDDGYGVDDALLLGRFEADHGDAAAAVDCCGRSGSASTTARRSRTRWAGRCTARATGEALKYAQKAMDTGGGTALYAYHLGVIEERLREYAPARRHLEEALRINPHFSPLAAPKARKALDALSPPSATDPRDVQPTPGPDPCRRPGPRHACSGRGNIACAGRPLTGRARPDAVRGTDSPGRRRRCTSIAGRPGFGPSGDLPSPTGTSGDYRCSVVPSVTTPVRWRGA